MSYGFKPLPRERLDIKELNARVVEKSGLKISTVEKVSHCLFEEMINAFTECRPVNIKDFGTFFIRATVPTATFKFNPSQRLRALFGWSSSYKKKVIGV